MGLADELRKLQELRDAGTLSDAEFAQAKAVLLANPATPASPSPRPDARSEAAKTWVTYQVVMGIIGLVVTAIFFFAFFLPNWNKTQRGHEEFQKNFDQRSKQFPGFAK